MATSTLPPKSPQEEDERYNTAANLSREEFNAGGSKSGGFSAEEKQRMHDRHVTDQMEGELANPTKSVRQRERDSGSDIPFENTGKRSGRGASPLSRSSNPLTAMNALRKGGPLGLIVSIILGLSALMFGSVSLLPVHLYENFLSRYDTGSTTYSLRTNLMFVNKLVDKGTSGDCQIKLILCRYQRPSKFMLDQLSNSKIEPQTKSGAKIENRTLWPNQRPYQLAFTDSSGTTKIIKATDLRKTLKGTDPVSNEFRSAYHNALKTRLQVFSDSIFKAVALRYGFTKQDTTKSATNEQEVTEKIAAETSGEPETTNPDGTIKPGGEESSSADEIENQISKTAEAKKNSLLKGTAGNLTGVVAGVLCTVADIPSIVTSAARSYQMAQLVRLGALFMTTVSALKAGDATSQEVSAMADALTVSSAGKNAMDSYGIRYSLYTDTSPNDDKNYVNYVPGGAVSGALGGIGSVLSSATKKAICGLAMSPATGVAIDLAISGETLGIGDLINIGGGVLAGLGIAAAIDLALPIVLHAIPANVYAALGEFAFGDIMKGLYINTGTSTGLSGGTAFGTFASAGALAAAVSQQAQTSQRMGGENFGDALSSGVANTLGQLANAGGNSPLTVQDMASYNQQTAIINQQYALEDQATLSPLDASSPNTMMGAFFEKIMPIYSQLGSLTSLMSSVGSIAGNAASGVLVGNSYAATDNTQQYQLCNDPNLKNADGGDVAAGPFCNIEYGIPTQYLDMDPQVIATDLVNAGQIDKNTGEAVPDAPLYTAGQDALSILGVPTGNQVSSYSEWLTLCTDGSSENAAACKITNRQIAEYALYTIDHRIQKNIDNEDTAATGGASSVTATTSGSQGGTGVQPTGTGITKYQDLSGSNFSSKINSASSNSIVSLASGTFSFNNFALGTQTIAPGNFAFGADISAKGIIGSGSSWTTISMGPNTSNKAGDVPTGNGTGGPTQPTNNLSYIIMRSPGATVDSVSIIGTDQGHLYNGLRYESVANPILENTVVSHIPGNSSANPGETFAVNFQRATGIATVKDVTIHGEGIGAAGIGINSSSATFNISGLNVSGLKYSAGIALWQQTGTVNIDNWTNSDGPRALGAERLGATVNLYDPNWAVPTSGHDVTYTPYSGYDSRINFYFSDASKVPSRKIVILTNTASVKSKVHVYIGGVEQNQSQYITWQGA